MIDRADGFYNEKIIRASEVFQPTPRYPAMKLFVAGLLFGCLLAVVCVDGHLRQAVEGVLL